MVPQSGHEMTMEIDTAANYHFSWIQIIYFACYSKCMWLMTDPKIQFSEAKIMTKFKPNIIRNDKAI